MGEYCRRVGSTRALVLASCCFMAMQVPAQSVAQDTRIISCGSPSAFQSKCNTGGYATAVRLVRDQSGGRC